MINRERLLQTFLQLVQVDSETKHEGKIAPFLKERFAALDCEIQEDNAMELTGHGANNLVITLPSNYLGAEKIYFTSHMDTVKPGVNIKPVVHEDGLITSSGDTILGADDKAGLAVMLEMLQIIQEQKLPHGQIQFVITVGEESGLAGAKVLDPQLLDAKYGFALDSNGKIGDLIVAAPYQVRIWITVKGKSAHAGVNPEDGISAIQVASKAISKMPLGRIDFETTANIGQFHGGEATNVVCDQVSILAEARSIDKKKVEKQVQAMKEAFAQTAEEHGATVDFQAQLMYPGFRYTEQDLVVQRAQAAVKTMGKVPVLKASGGGSDANIIASYGIPTINLAVGYEQIHTTNERIHMDRLVETAQLALQLIQVALPNR